MKQSVSSQTKSTTNQFRRRLMELIYRGATYHYSPAQAKARRPTQPTRQSAYDLIYRGNTYRCDPTLAQPAVVKLSSYELIYRGNTYQVNRNGAGEMTAISCSTNLFKPKAVTPDAVMQNAK
jgi:Domain of unknown function (DUF4278)